MPSRSSTGASSASAKPSRTSAPSTADTRRSTTSSPSSRTASEASRADARRRAHRAHRRVGPLAYLVRPGCGAGCGEAVLCGGIRKPKLFDIRPDWLALKALARMRSFGDDAALRAIAAALEEEGVRIVSPLPFVPDLLAPSGPLGKRRFTDEQRADAAAGRGVGPRPGGAGGGPTGVVERRSMLAGA